MFRKLKLLASFSALQGVVQVVSALSGFILVRALDKREFAAYTIAAGMQTILNLLTDSGIGSGLNALGGRVWQQRDALSRLVSTAFEFRRQLALFALPIGVGLSLWLLRQNEVPWPKTLALAVVVVSGLWGIWTASIYSVPLRLHGRYLAVQWTELITALVRLVLIGGLALVFLNSLVALLVMAVAFTVQGILITRNAFAVIDTAAPPDAQCHAELKTLVRKQIFSTAFFAFQGQITVWLIGVFGTVEKVAEVGALGRLAIVFAIVGSVMNGVVSPTFARCDSLARLKRQFVMALAAYTAFAGLVLLASFLLPHQILLILGSKYSDLTAELPWLVGTSVVSGFASVIYGLAAARGWIWQAWLLPIVTLTMQAALLPVLNLGQVRGVLAFGFWSVMPMVLISSYMVIRGMSESKQAGRIVTVLD